MTTLEELQIGLGLASEEVFAFLRSDPDVYALTPSGEWTVRDTAVHLICFSRLWNMLLTDRPSPMRAAYDTSVLNASLFLAMDEDRPKMLADLAERAVASLLDRTTGRRLEDPWRYSGNDLTVGLMVAAECLEYLLHGFDMARAVGRDWAFSEPAADLALAVVGPVFLFLLDPAKAGDLQASFAIEGGSGRICRQARAGSMEILDADADADCSIAGPSSQLLVWLTGRVGWDDAELSASGRRPDVARTLADKLVHF
jgi:uncharacterized protein (TIGR03083 family)